MALIKRMTLAGLAVMAGVAVTTAIWPVVAGMVFALLVTVLCAATAAPTVLGVRWVRGELAWRRELPTMPPVGLAMQNAVALAPTLAELRESA